MMDAWLDHGAGMTYTAAKSSGADVEFVDMKGLFNFAELKRRLRDFDLVAFGLKSAYYPLAMNIIKVAKENGSKVMVAGYHVTAAPKELEENSDIDWIMKGESEITFPEFLKNPDDYPRSFEGEKPQDLDSLPFMERRVFREPVETCSPWWHDRMVSVMTARGCPYNCGFCQPLERNHFGRKIRRRSVDSTIAELLYLKKRHNPQCVVIHDDTFLFHPTWVEEFIEKYPQVGLPFWAAGRADGICKRPHLVKGLIDIGWEMVSVGFESGSQRLLDIMKKGTTVEQNYESARIVKSFGASIFANYMLGLPGETRADIDATIEMAKVIDAEHPSWAFFAPYPGCELGESCIDMGLSLLDRTSYHRYPSEKKVKGVDYDYIVNSLNNMGN